MPRPVSDTLQLTALQLTAKGVGHPMQVGAMQV